MVISWWQRLIQDSTIRVKQFIHWASEDGVSGKKKKKCKWKLLSHVQHLWPHGLHSPWNSPDQNTGVGSLSLLQGIFSTQGFNPGLPHSRQILYQLSHKLSPRTLKWVAYPFSSGSSRPRNWTGVSCITGGFFTNWAIREAPVVTNLLANAGDIRDTGSILGWGRSLGERQGNPLQYLCLENSEDRGASMGYST